MGRDWAVASSAALVGFALLVLTDHDALFAGWPRIVAAIALGAWAYAIGDAAYGARGPLVAQLAYGLGTLALSALSTVRCFALGVPCVQSVDGVAVLVATLLGAWCAVSVGRELATRRGIIHWGSTLAALLPLLVLVAWLVLAFATPASK